MYSLKKALVVFSASRGCSSIFLVLPLDCPGSRLRVLFQYIKTF